MTQTKRGKNGWVKKKKNSVVDGKIDGDDDNDTKDDVTDNFTDRRKLRMKVMGIITGLRFMNDDVDDNENKDNMD